MKKLKNILQPIFFKSAFNCFPDNRGLLTAFDPVEFASKYVGASIDFRYQLLSVSNKANTFRGLHYQKPPSSQTKLILIHKGKILDFVVPYKNASKIDLKHFELESGDALLVPRNYAHGFLTLEDNVILQYVMDVNYDAACYAGINAVDFIEENYASKPVIVSSKDKEYVHRLT